LKKGVRRKAGEEFEPCANPSVSNENRVVSGPGGAKAAVAHSVLMHADEDFAAFVLAWPSLPPAIKAGITAIVRALAL
jgi:hypothetical protein